MPPNSPFAPSLTSRAVSARPIQFGGASAAASMAHVAIEAPVNLVYGSIPYAVMMATPADLEDFVAGFSLTEGIIREAGEIRQVTVTPKPEGIVVEVDLAPGRLREHLARRRNLSGRTSCGLCGVEDFDGLPVAQVTPVVHEPIAAAAIERAIASLDAHQPLNHLTRSVHAAAWCDVSGDILAAREDVGRHNALDKLIGARIRRGHDAAGGFIIVTSRASFEMVEKAAIFGAGTLVTVSAPTSLAIERAERLGLTLASIARRDGVTLFAGSLATERETQAQ